MLRTSNEATVIMGSADPSEDNPILTAVQNGAAAVELEWTYNGPNVDGWTVFRRVGAGAYVQISQPGEINFAARAYADVGGPTAPAPSAGQTLTYKVQGNSP
jgi:hypothetical protein